MAETCFSIIRLFPTVSLTFKKTVPLRNASCIHVIRNSADSSHTAAALIHNTQTVKITLKSSETLLWPKSRDVFVWFHWVCEVWSAGLWSVQLLIDTVLLDIELLKVSDRTHKTQHRRQITAKDPHARTHWLLWCFVQLSCSFVDSSQTEQSGLSRF